MDGDNSDLDQMDYPKYAPPTSTPTTPAVRHRIFGRTTTVLGSVATRTSLRIRQIAAYEVNIPQPREIVAGLKHIIPGTSRNEKTDAGHNNDNEKKDNKKVISDSVPLQTMKTGAYTDSEDELRKGNKSQQDTGSEQKQQDKITTDAERDDKLKKILAESNEVLASANTVFPFSLFPDSVVLDRTKVTITRRNFFFSSEVMSMRIDDILNVTTSVGPFLGSVTLAGRVLSSEDHFTITNFWRNDAIHLKHIIQGYIIARHNNIDCEHLGKEELIATLTRLGHDTGN